MCGRCVILTFDEVLGVIQHIEVYVPISPEADWPARRSSQALEAFPNSLVPVMVPTFDTARPFGGFAPGSLEARNLAWGFEESWKPGVVFNTRIESAAKPTWRESMEHRRCVIPVTSFFETHESEKVPSPRTGRPVKRPYRFEVPGESIVLIGGIWRDGRFSMVTTEASAAMAPIHHRMPLVLRQEELPLWLGPDYARLADRSAIPLNAEPADAGGKASASAGDELGQQSLF